MESDEILIATLGKHGQLVARYVGEWKKQGGGWPDALVLTWTIALGDAQLELVDGDTGARTDAPLDGLEARGWVKPNVSELSDGRVQLTFDVFLGAACSSIKWRVDTQAKRIEQWADSGASREN